MTRSHQDMASDFSAAVDVMRAVMVEALSQLVADVAVAPDAAAREGLIAACANRWATAQGEALKHAALAGGCASTWKPIHASVGGSVSAAVAEMRASVRSVLALVIDAAAMGRQLADRAADDAADLIAQRYSDAVAQAFLGASQPARRTSH